MEKFEPQGTDNQVGLALLCRFGIHVRNQISYTHHTPWRRFFILSFKRLGGWEIQNKMLMHVSCSPVFSCLIGYSIMNKYALLLLRHTLPLPSTIPVNETGPANPNNMYLFLALW